LSARTRRVLAADDAGADDREAARQLDEVLDLVAGHHAHAIDGDRRWHARPRSDGEQEPIGLDPGHSIDGRDLERLEADEHTAPHEVIDRPAPCTGLRERGELADDQRLRLTTRGGHLRADAGHDATSPDPS